MSKPAFPSPAWFFARRVELASLIGGIGFVFFLFTPVHFTRLVARLLALPEESFVRAVYLALALLNLLAGSLRIWAGGTLGGARMMSIHVQTEGFIIAGPYAHVRNPIYLGELLLCLGWAMICRSVIGVALVPLWWLGLLILIIIEEESLEHEFGAPYVAYKQRVRGRILPGLPV